MAAVVAVARAAALIASLSLLAALAGGCGGSSDDDADSGRWLRPPRGLPAHPFPVRSEREAARVVRHQVEDHCSEEFTEARCTETADTWECDYRSGRRTGHTSIEKSPSGERVDCSG